MQLKEALDFSVACCPELELAGYSQQIYISLQELQNIYIFLKQVWLRRQICTCRYCSVSIHRVMAKANKETDLVLRAVASLGVLQSRSSQVREKEWKSKYNKISDTEAKGKKQSWNNFTVLLCQGKKIALVTWVCCSFQEEKLRLLKTSPLQSITSVLLVFCRLLF